MPCVLVVLLFVLGRFELHATLWTFSGFLLHHVRMHWTCIVTRGVTVIHFYCAYLDDKSSISCSNSFLVISPLAYRFLAIDRLSSSSLLCLLDEPAIPRISKTTNAITTSAQSVIISSPNPQSPASMWEPSL